MSYIVKAISTVRSVGWIRKTRFNGLRIVGERESAEAFPTKQGAYAAIYSMSRVLSSLGASYAIEAKDHSAPVPSILAEMGEQA